MWSHVQFIRISVVFLICGSLNMILVETEEPRLRIEVDLPKVNPRYEDKYYIATAGNNLELSCVSNETQVRWFNIIEEFPSLWNAWFALDFEEFSNFQDTAKFTKANSNISINKNNTVHKYTNVLKLFNVSSESVGYYYCVAETAPLNVHPKDMSIKIEHEFIHLNVNDTQDSIVKVPDTIWRSDNCLVTVPCRSTIYPLFNKSNRATAELNNKPINLIWNEAELFQLPSWYFHEHDEIKCSTHDGTKRETYEIVVKPMLSRKTCIPLNEEEEGEVIYENITQLIMESKTYNYGIENKSLQISCAVHCNNNFHPSIEWTLPNDNDIKDTSRFTTTAEGMNWTLTILNPSAEKDIGEYTCSVKLIPLGTTIAKMNITHIFKPDDSFINATWLTSETITTNRTDEILLVRYWAYPEIKTTDVTLTKDGIELEIEDGSKYDFHLYPDRGYVYVKIKNLRRKHSGKYIFTLKNGEKKSVITSSLNVTKADPEEQNAPSIGITAVYMGVLFGVCVVLVAVYVVAKTVHSRRYRQIEPEKPERLPEAVPKPYTIEDSIRSILYPTNRPRLNSQETLDRQVANLRYIGKEIQPESLKLGEKIGEGNFGEVVEATGCGLGPKNTDIKVAVKRIKPKFMSRAQTDLVDSFLSEMKILSHMGNHMNVVKFIGGVFTNASSTDEIDLMIVVGYCYFGSVEDFIQKNRDYINQPFEDIRPPTSGAYVTLAQVNKTVRQRSFNVKDLMSWAYQVARGMEHIASRKILHSDLAARNVLLCENNIVKIGDFGLARTMYRNQYHSTSNKVMPYRWLAIESLRHNDYSTKSDVWSFGVFCWELFSLCQVPYLGVDDAPDLVEKLENGLRLSQPNYAPHEIYELMKKAWSATPANRPTFEYLQKQLFFQLGSEETDRLSAAYAQYSEDNPLYVDMSGTSQLVTESNELIELVTIM